MTPAGGEIVERDGVKSIFSTWRAAPYPILPGHDGPGETAAMYLRGILYDEPIQLALEEAAVGIEYPAKTFGSPSKSGRSCRQCRRMRLSGHTTSRFAHRRPCAAERRDREVGLSTTTGKGASLATLWPRFLRKQAKSAGGAYRDL